MSEAVAGGIGGFVGGLIGSLLGRGVTITTPNGVPIARVLIEPWDFLGVSVIRLRKSDGVKQLNISGNIKSILLKADANNTGRVWLGGSDVAINNGYPLDGNSTISMQVRNFDRIHLVADSDFQQIVYVVKLGEST